MKIPEKMLKKKKQLVRASKQKTSITKLNYKTVIISTLNNFEKKNLSTSILEIKVLILSIKKVNITIIDANIY